MVAGTEHRQNEYMIKNKKQYQPHKCTMAIALSRPKKTYRMLLKLQTKHKNYKKQSWKPHEEQYHHSLWLKW